ncbi:hypothetical protein [Allomuricauda sp. SCSIO 65647]|uniref:hypothetical protein n=1 Tax=Allomuricauda sp. SCSIO 65647 TaxID=2908843 RepID=UPI001F190F95|nr:hypothetical protein [Muricauda sp. SCSIO 65647]UJH67767.1 hypothetical protein L0P89_00775 [Muricauda sp. SCSIO 65647]
MRTLKTTLLIIMALCLMPDLLQGQEKKTQAFWIHEDVVKPSMVDDYEAICKDLTANMKKHNIQEVNVIVSNTIDDRYMWVSPISSMADIEKPIFATLAEKMGGTAMADLFNKMDKCYDIEQNYIIHLDEELSYMPDGLTLTPEGEPYRKFHYFHYTPGDRAAVKEKVEAIKKMFEGKGSKLHYRVYKSGFGTRGEFYMVAVAAKDAADYAAKISSNNAMLGDEWQKLYNEFRSSLSKYEQFEAIMRPDMAYSPSQ